ncbi:MAG: hypothetical protein Q9195_001189 [Heterodermia aff. obscurata]
MATNPAPLWDLEPLYREATRRNPDQNDPTAYIVTPRGDVSKQDVLYRIAPPSTRAAFSKTAKPPQKKDTNGNLVFESWPIDPANPRPLIDYPVLPDQIALNVEWWRLAAWRRLEPRLSWADIVMRMRPAEGLRTRDAAIDTRAMNARIFHKRNEFAILSWDNSRGGKDEDLIVEKLCAYPGAIESNSSRGVTPGLIDLTGPDVETNRVPLPNAQSRKIDRALRDSLASENGKSPQESAGPAVEPYAPTNPPTNAQTASDSLSYDASDVESSLSSIFSARRTPEPSSPRRRRTSTEILADRLLIVATKGARSLAPGASTNFEEWSPEPQSP